MVKNRSQFLLKFILKIVLICGFFASSSIMFSSDIQSPDSQKVKNLYEMIENQGEKPVTEEIIQVRKSLYKLFEFIERQQGGIQTLKHAAHILDKIIIYANHCFKSGDQPDLKVISTEALDEVKNAEKCVAGEQLWLSLSDEDIKDLKSFIDHGDQILSKSEVWSLLKNRINKPAYCELVQIGFHLNFVVGGGIQKLDLVCESPYGRFITYSGSTYGLSWGLAGLFTGRGYKKGESIVGKPALYQIPLRDLSGELKIGTKLANKNIFLEPRLNMKSSMGSTPSRYFEKDVSDAQPYVLFMWNNPLKYWGKLSLLTEGVGYVGDFTYFLKMIGIK